MRHFLGVCRGRCGVVAFLVFWLFGGGLVHAAEPSPDTALRALSEAISQIKARYVGAVDDRKLAETAIRAMLQSLDPYSDYLDADTYLQLKQENSGRFVGLGMEVGMEAGAVRVVSTYEDSPAYQAGLRSGDLITRLDDVSVEGMTLDQAIQRARGAPDTSIMLTVLRKGQGDPHVIRVKRALIQSRSVKAVPLAPGYAYARITGFNQRTPESLLSALAQFSRDSGGLLRGVLIDLRDNPGGLLKSAVGVSSIFLPDDTLAVYTEAAAAESRMTLTTSEKQYFPSVPEDSLRELPSLKTVPVVVLVNSGSASASEVLAGALQDLHRATIVGSQTFGKGSVQVLVPLSDGSALKLTTAYYLTPAGQRIQGRGVTPDRVIGAEPLPPPAGAGGAAALPAVNSTCTQISEASVRQAAAVSIATGGVLDCQLVRALDLLQHLPVIAKN